MTMKVEVTYDLGIKLDNDHLGNKNDWEAATAFGSLVAEQFGLEQLSAGTGWGVRDMQLQGDPTKPDYSDQIEQLAKEQNVDLKYYSRYYTVENRTVEEYEQNKRYCPQCKGDLDGPTEIEQVDKGGYVLYYECMECPDILDIRIRIPSQPAK